MSYRLLLMMLLQCFLTEQANLPAHIGGSWETIIPEAGGGAIGKVLGMQTVHAVLLPSDKILLVSGSSWRNFASVDHYPQTEEPEPSPGLFGKEDDPFRKEKLNRYFELVNNAAIYDIRANTFFRIQHPVPIDDPDIPGGSHFAPNDLFCTGHQHLPNGNVFFVGGTQYSSPFTTGHRSTFIFDWQKEMNISWPAVDWRRTPSKPNNPWSFAGLMKRGRWYASILPLLDGRMMIFGGYVGFDAGFPSMYIFEMNRYIEFFDPRTSKWSIVDVKSLPNSPFSTLINPTFKPTEGYQCGRRCIEDNKYDAFKLYPENYLYPDGRIFLTREGDWTNTRTKDGAFMRRTNRTYWIQLGRRDDQLSFSPGPDRLVEVSSYGTTYLDPNTGNIHLLGGQPFSTGVRLYNDSRPDNYFAGSRGSRKLEQFVPSTEEPNGGHWTIDPDFLSGIREDDRAHHYTLILPTRQILVVAGGNYDYYGSIHSPVLLTPRYNRTTKQFIGYRKRRMNEHVESRSYHATAILLPDGRVWLSGGNIARAAIQPRTGPLSPHNTSSGRQPLPDLDRIDLDFYFTLAKNVMGRAPKGSSFVPSEIWIAEIFSPPYLFIDGDRRAEIVSLNAVRKVIGDRLFYLLRSNQSYIVQLSNLPTSSCKQKKASLVLMKLSWATHGWDGGQKFFSLSFSSLDRRQRIRLDMPDANQANLPPAYYMMFYVDCKGKPSKAQMIRFDDSVHEL